MTETDTAHRNQFSLLSLMWLTTATALLFSYARWVGGDALQQAVVFMVFGTVIGFTVGWLIGDIKNCLFWSLLLTLLAYLAVAGGRLPNAAVLYGWGIVGAFCGAISVMTVPKNQFLAALLMGAVGCLAMIGTIVCFPLRFTLEPLLLFDVGSAAIIGALLRPFLSFVQWFERQSGQPRVLLASWLTISVLIGNFLVPVLAGVRR
jgi:hypothetical protein